MAEFRLETERLVLRDWREADAEPFFRHTNTPAVMRYLDGVMDEGRQAAQLERIRACRAEHGHCFWIVERKSDDRDLAGEILGFCGLKRANQEGAPIGDFEIGWRLREDAWGRGYAREAAAAVMTAGFQHFHAPHMIALTVEANAPSWGLMRRLGMVRRHDLDFASDVFGSGLGPIIIYSITEAQWRSARTANA
ncbi:MAG: GNAT family N-acetyltransferase [Sphingomonadales bacterium]|nr:GNAT family N-acetyltransferase [Sphingomonadales bacterium]